MRFRWIDDRHVKVFGNMGGYYGTYEASSAWVQDNEVHVQLLSGQIKVIKGSCRYS